MEWGLKQDRAFQTLRKEFQVAPALGLPNLAKPFVLCLGEKQDSSGRDNPGLRVLAQTGSLPLQTARRSR